MSNDQRRKAKKKKDIQAQRRQDAARDSKFIDGVDSYCEEFRRVLTKPSIWGLSGVFVIADDDYHALKTEELLARVGFGDHRCISWDSGHKKDDHSKRGKAAGMTCAVMTTEGRVLPVVFLREGVTLDAPGSEFDEQFADMTRLLVLLHELGHAEDIYREVNFNHRAATVEIVEAEAYAHDFVIKYLQKRNCRLALKHYIGQLDQWIAEDSTAEEYVKLAAQRVIDTRDMKSLREYCNREFNEVAWQKRVLRKRIEEGLRLQRKDQSPPPENLG